MFNFNINWLKIISENVPKDIHSVWLFDWIKVLISPFVKIYQEFLIAYDVYLLKIRFNGQKIYLEKILNDKFSPVSGGIYIDNGISNSPIYIYRNSESKPPIFLYRLWNSSYNYLINQYAVQDNIVYKCAIANINSSPKTNPSKWSAIGAVTFLKRIEEHNMQYNFIVKVPSSITFDMVAMRGIIDFYRLAGKKYKIVIY